MANLTMEQLKKIQDQAMKQGISLDKVAQVAKQQNIVIPTDNIQTQTYQSGANITPNAASQ